MEKKEIEKVENICEKALGIKPQDIDISIISKFLISIYLKNNKKTVLISENFDNHPIIIKYKKTLQMNSLIDNIMIFINDDDKDNYLTKLSIINDVIKFYNFDENTKFILKIVFDDGRSEVLKEGNYRDCIDYFWRKDFAKKNNLKTLILRTSMLLKKKYKIIIIDDKNNYSDELFENK